MQRRIEAHLLLAAAPTARLREWTRIFTGLRGDDPVIIERGANAIQAAVVDPSSFAEAESLYRRSLLTHMNGLLQLCQSVARDPFVRQHYLTGEGSHPPDQDERIIREFAESVEEARRDSLQEQARTPPRR
jgi:hypothetical protein